MTASYEETISFNHPNPCSHDRHDCNRKPKLSKRTKRQYTRDQHNWRNKCYNGRKHDKLRQHDNFIWFIRSGV